MESANDSLLSTNDIQRMMSNKKGTKFNMRKAKNNVTFKSGYALTVKYKPMHIQLHDPSTHTYVMYFQLIPTVSRRENKSTKRKIVSDS